MGPQTGVFTCWTVLDATNHQSDLRRHCWLWSCACRPQPSRGRHATGRQQGHQFLAPQLIKEKISLECVWLSACSAPKVCVENKQGIAELNLCKFQGDWLNFQWGTFGAEFRHVFVCIWWSDTGVYVCAPGKESPGSRLVVVVVGVGEGGRPLGPGQSSPCEAAWSPFKFL